MPHPLLPTPLLTPVLPCVGPCCFQSHLRAPRCVPWHVVMGHSCSSNQCCAVCYVLCCVLCAVMCGDVQSAAVPGETLCGICAIAFRKDGLALAAYSRISGFVYIWTMHPAWLTRMSNAGASRSPFSSLLSAAVPSTAAASVQLQPLRVMAAPAAAPPPPAELAAGPADLTFALTWAADGRTLELRHDSRLLGSMPVQCP